MMHHDAPRYTNHSLERLNNPKNNQLMPACWTYYSSFYYVTCVLGYVWDGFGIVGSRPTDHNGKILELRWDGFTQRSISL